MQKWLLPLAASLLIAACDQLAEDPTPVQVETPPATLQEAEAPATPPEAQRPETGTIAEQKKATIDWDAARTDFASRETSENDLAEVASGGSAFAVPILLPDEPFGVASTGDDGLQFRPLADGYFAVKKGEAYDLIINGTDKLVARPDVTNVPSDTPLKYEETMTGALVAFSRYGASYLVEFMCKEREAVLDGSCINEADALAEVEKLLIAGTR